MSISKTALAARMAARLGMSRANCETMIEQTLHELGRALANGEAVKLPGFGTFRLHRQEPRGGKAPDGRQYVAPAKTVVKFRAGKTLAASVAPLDLG